MYACLSSARHGSLREASASFSTTSRTPPPITPASSPVVIATRSFCMETQAVGQSSSGDGVCSVDEQDLARAVCGRGRSKQDCGAHHFLGLGDATCRSSGHSHFLPLRIAPKILGEGGPNH